MNSDKNSSTSSATKEINLNLTNILKDTAASNGSSANESLAQRVKFLQTKLAHAPMPSITSKRRQLPSIEEAWNLPISAEMSSRQQQTAQSNQQRAYTKSFNHVSIINILNHKTEINRFFDVFFFFFFIRIMLKNHKITKKCQSIYPMIVRL